MARRPNDRNKGVVNETIELAIGEAGLAPISQKNPELATLELVWSTTAEVVLYKDGRIRSSPNRAFQLVQRRPKDATKVGRLQVHRDGRSILPR
ncbi:hypothetical protein ABIE33_006820 [Ensifer sp. 4252]